MGIRLRLPAMAILSLLAFAGRANAAPDSEDAIVAAVRKNAEQVMSSFNAGKADEVAGKFLPQGELIDESGNVHKGQQAIQDLLAAFFTQFPGAKLTLDIESIRPVGPVVLEEGTRTVSTADGAARAHLRYIAVWIKGEQGWQLASFRDFANDSALSPHDRLQSIDWLVGEWLNEGADGKVAISFRWSDDKNYLLGEFQIEPTGGAPRKSSQRIGWDPSIGRIRSWLFDADGGFAEGVWTVTEDGAVIKSSAVNPTGATASATLYFTSIDENRFSIEGFDRVVGDTLEDDFEIVVTRRPPAAGK